MPVAHTYDNPRPTKLGRHVIAGQTFRIAHRNGLSQNAQVGVRHIPDRQEGSPQAEVPALLVTPGDVHVTTKKSLDSFLHTALDFLLRQVYDAETVVLAGVTTDTCVYSPAFGAFNRGRQHVVISDYVASMRGK